MPPLEMPTYLQPGFDPKSIKMDSIRDILIDNGIKPPTGLVKKSQLVEMFEKEIRPRIPKLREEFLKIQPSEEGIIKVPSSGRASSSSAKARDAGSKVVAKPHETKAQPKAPATKAGVSRTTTPKKADLSEKKQKASPTISSAPAPSEENPPTTTRRSNSKDSSTTRGRKSYRSTLQSDEDNEEPRTTVRRRKPSSDKKKSRSNNFSDENPFQSGSESEKKRSKSRNSSRSSSTSSSTHRSHRKSRDGSTGRSRRTTDHGFSASPTAVPYQPLFSSYMQAPPPQYTPVFDRDGQNEFQHQSPLLFTTKGRTMAESSHSRERGALSWLYPSCIPCPELAACVDPHTTPTCPSEYILRPHSFSFNNILPLSPKCVLDRAKEYQSFRVADVSEKILRMKAGDEECKVQLQPISEAELVARQRISVDELRKTLLSKKEPTVSNEEFERYWGLALKELHRRSASIVVEEGTGKLKARRKERRTVNGLVENTLSKLATQSHYHYVDPVIFPEPFLPHIHLRDALLTGVHTPARRNELWEKVKAIVEKNSNVRVGTQEYKGEVHRVWEWIGAAGVLGTTTTAGGMDGQSRFPGMVPRGKPQLGPQGSFFGITRQDSEYLNPVSSLYPSLSQQYDDSNLDK
ncbi:inner nuclear membrane protein enriched at telomere/subtelomere region [Lunasporangiospora selenospora]|uniref:Inner nuclear membrane protein enriched at telomere/subtelomere region n=1 Tax=Lunasporangiospora selenospora TaxID=979761 RepID=A0A9P6FRN0_9FUNG|nr:inner nuclear membrane protein enriched at telomere/subtelomere region [Lunasporangiospora selenospora]